MPRLPLLLVALAVALVLAGCSRAPKDATPEAAARLFAARCAKCHGTDGAADGEDTAQFQPRPHSFRDAAWQASVEDAWLARIIVGGGKAVGRSDRMPPNPDLANGPTLPALIRHIRSLQQPPGRSVP